jgi:hyperosmotically inducible protein
MDRNIAVKAGLVAFSSLALMGLAACNKPGPAESAGQNIDQSMDKIGQKADQVAERAKEDGSKAGQAVDDTSITAAVKAGILAEPALKVLQINVETKDGRVTLSGTADTAQSAQKATQIASNVSGVKGVDNQITVSKT